MATPALRRRRNRPLGWAASATTCCRRSITSARACDSAASAARARSSAAARCSTLSSTSQRGGDLAGQRLQSVVQCGLEQRRQAAAQGPVHRALDGGDIHGADHATPGELSHLCRAYSRQVVRRGPQDAAGDKGADPGRRDPDPVGGLGDRQGLGGHGHGASRRDERVTVERVPGRLRAPAGAPRLWSDSDRRSRAGETCWPRPSWSCCLPHTPAYRAHRPSRIATHKRTRAARRPQLALRLHRPGQHDGRPFEEGPPVVPTVLIRAGPHCVPAPRPGWCAGTGPRSPCLPCRRHHRRAWPRPSPACRR